MSSPTQYDSIGTRYNQMHDLPGVETERPTVIKALGSVKGLRALDLACGTGRYSRLLIELGAASVLGIDISPVMVEGAKAASKDDARLDFRVGDCAKPFQVPEGPFDIIFGGWFLNYAESREELLSMWKNIYTNLKPGGRFIGLIPNLDVNFEDPLDDKYGFIIKLVGEVRDGKRFRLTAATQPPVEFEFFMLPKHMYVACATEAGMEDIKWQSTVIPDDERKETGFWDEFLKKPYHVTMLARRPE